ncbi:MAG: sensor histidine kinase [Pseudobdellovibrionaceae bacterium]
MQLIVLPQNSSNPQPIPSASLATPTCIPFSFSLNDPRTSILFLSTNLDVAELVTSSLEPEMQVIQVSSTSEAIFILKQRIPEMVLCDLGTPCLELLQLMTGPEFFDVPLIYLSNPMDRKSKLSFLSQRKADFLFHPFEPEELQIRVQNHLENFRARKILQPEVKKKNTSLDQMVQEMTLKTRELQRLNRMKDEFMAVLSHELRNPLNVISGFAEILKTDEDQTEMAKEAADAIYRNAQVQIKMVTDLLDVSRSIAGKMVLDCKPMEIAALIHELLPSTQEAAAKKELQLHIVPSPCRGLINGDACRISQVVWNLLSNAIKFTPNKGRIEVRLRHEGPWVEFSVQDSGCGIEPEFLPHMFERFHQQDPTITKNYGGLGLGLAIVRHIVELHGGSIHAVSGGAGQGATFFVKLPALLN